MDLGTDYVGHVSHRLFPRVELLYSHRKPHTHPSPPEAQHLDSPMKLYPPSPGATVHVDFRGLPGEAGLKIADIYCPEVRRPPFIRANNVNRLDVVSCWKGLSYTQAADIALWKRLLGDALGEQLEEGVRATVLDGMSAHIFPNLESRSDGTANPTEHIPHTLSTVSATDVYCTLFISMLTPSSRRPVADSRPDRMRLPVALHNCR